jgi:SNF2 family DNA or RNA helicase
MAFELTYYQENAQAYASTVTHPALIMDMRLGKSVVSDRVADMYDARTRLILTELGAFHGWKTVFTEQDQPWLDLRTVTPNRREDAVVKVLDSRHPCYVLANYELACAMPILGDLPWDYVAADESRKIANPATAVSQLCTRKFRDVGHRSILCGLPAPESELELFQQFLFLHGKFMGHTNYYKFRYEYFKPGMHGNNWGLKKGARAAIKEALHAKSFVLRRKDVVDERNVFEHRTVEMTSRQRKIYESVAKDFAWQDSDDKWQETQWRMTAEMWMQRLAGGFTPDGEEVLSEAKMLEIISLASGQLQGEQMVIWFKFRKELQYVLSALEKRKYRCVYVDGTVLDDDKELAQKRFQSGDAQFILATEKSLKKGADLSAADVAIYYSNEYSIDDRFQTQDRIFNMNKVGTPLLYIDLMTEDSVDDDVAAKIRDQGFNAKDLLRKHIRRFRL